MKARKSFRKGMAFLLTLAMVIGTFGLEGWGTGEAYAVGTEDITVTVAIENDTYPVASGAAWEGTLYTSSVTVSAGATMMDAIEQSLINEGYYGTSSISGSYISSINEVAAGATGTYSGWLGALNGVLPNVGFGSSYVSEGDNIRLMYSLPSGYCADPAVSWGTSNAASSGFSFSDGIWSSESDGWGGYAITLTVPDPLEQIVVTEIAGTTSPALRIYKYDSGSWSMDESIVYRIGDEIPLSGLGTNFDSLFVYLNDGATETCTINIRNTGDINTANLLSGTVGTLAEDPTVNYWNIIGVNAYNLSHSAVSFSGSQAESFVGNAISDFAAPESYYGTRLAMDIIALTSLGYDASKIVSDGASINGYAVMKEQIEEDTAYGGWAEVYAYSLMAYMQTGDNTYDSEINTAIANLEAMEPNGWEAAWGSADSVGIALAALSMAVDKGYTVDSNVIDSGINFLEEVVTIKGVVADSYYLTENANSTAMTIIGLDAAGVDVSEISTAGGTDLLNGIKLYSDKNAEGFIYSDGSSHNTSASQQGFLALLAANMAGNTNIFDFSGKGIYTAASSYDNCPVFFNILPPGADLEVTDSNGTVQEERFTAIYDLPAGTYDYSVAKEGYSTKTGSFAISAESAADHSKQTIKVSLASLPDTGDDITVKVYVKTHDESECNNSYTYKNNSSEYYSIVSETLTLDKNSTVFDALDAALEAAGKTYNESSYGYISEIDGISEFSHGENSGWLYKVNGDVTSINCRDYKLTKNSTIVWWFTDDYVNDDGSEMWSGGSGVPTATSAAFADIDVKVSKGVAVATISNSELDKLAEAGSAIRVTSALATIEMDAETVLGLSKAASGSIEITASMVDLDSLDSIGDIVKDQIGDRPVIDLSVTSEGKTISQFAGEVAVEVPYTLAKGENPNAIVMYLLNDKGELEMIKGCSYDAESKTVKFVTDHFSVYAVGHNYKGFTDIEGNWAADYINYLAARDIISGMTDTAFAPGAHITRAQFVQLLANMAGEDMASYGTLSTSGFKDVDVKAWYSSAVAWAVKEKIVLGFENADGTWSFDPNGYVTRQDMAVLLMRYMSGFEGAEIKSGNPVVFADEALIAGYAKAAVDKMSAAGVLNGKTATTFAPSDQAARSEAAKMIYVLYSQYM